jgi:hypothetical protein
MSIAKHFLIPFGISLLVAVTLAVVLFTPQQKYIDRYFTEMCVFQELSYEGYHTYGMRLWRIIEELRGRQYEFTQLSVEPRYEYLHALMGTYMKTCIRALVARAWRPGGIRWRREKRMASEIFDEILRELTVRHGY